MSSFNLGIILKIINKNTRTIKLGFIIKIWKTIINWPYEDLRIDIIKLKR